MLELMIDWYYYVLIERLSIERDFGEWTGVKRSKVNGFLEVSIFIINQISFT